jgi:glycosyltransferase involved in cell wall biosynthesis
VGRLAAFKKKLKIRWHPEIDSSRVTLFVRYHFLARATMNLLGKSRLARTFNLEPWADRRFDHRASRWMMSQSTPALVHCFEGFALEVFDQARAQGSITILEVGSAHEFGVAEINHERRRYGLKQMRSDTARIRAERANADILLAPSDYVIACLVENGVERSRIVKLPYGVDSEAFRPVTRRDKGETFRVVFVGRVSFRKGVVYLLEAWEKLRLDRAELVIAGGIDSELRPAVRNLPANVRLLGNVTGPMLSSLYSESDVFVLPSLSDGFGLVVLEAMASELPVIVTQACGAPVRDQTDGYVVPTRDAHAIAERLAWLCARPDLRAAMGQSGSRLVRERFTWRHYRRRMAALYFALGQALPVQEAVDTA